MRPQLQALSHIKNDAPRGPQANTPAAWSRLQRHGELQRPMAQQRQGAGHQPEQANGRGGNDRDALVMSE